MEFDVRDLGFLFLLAHDFFSFLVVVFLDESE